MLVDRPRGLARLAGGEGASAVGAVAIQLRAHVEDDQLASTDLALARLGVRQSAVGAGGDDRRERGLGTLLTHPRLGRAGDVELAATRQTALQREAPDLIGELGGGGDCRQLVLVLDPAQLLDRAGGALECYAVRQFLFQALQRAYRHVVVFEARLAAEPGGDAAQPVVADGDHVPALDLGFGALGVAEVGEEDAQLGTADAGAVGAAEAGQVADVDEVGDEQGVELALGDEGGEAIGAARHQPGPAPSSRASSSSASR